MRHVLGIVVNFVGDHLNDKKVTKYQHIGQILSEDPGLQIPFPTIQVVLQSLCEACVKNLEHC